MTESLTIIIIYSDLVYIKALITHSGILSTLKVMEKLRCHFQVSEALEGF